MTMITRTQLREEEDGHDEGGHEGNDAAGEGSAVEILIDLGVRIQQLQLIQHVHGTSTAGPKDGRRRTDGRTDEQIRQDGADVTAVL